MSWRHSNTARSEAVGRVAVMGVAVAGLPVGHLLRLRLVRGDFVRAAGLLGPLNLRCHGGCFSRRVAAPMVSLSKSS